MDILHISTVNTQSDDSSSRVSYLPDPTTILHNNANGSHGLQKKILVKLKEQYEEKKTENMA